MRRTNRVLRLLAATLAVWCLGCDAFDRIAESLVESRAPEWVASVTAAPADVGLGAADACECAFGHAAVVSVPTTPRQPPPAAVEFVDGPRSVLLPAPEPPLRPPVA